MKIINSTSKNVNFEIGIEEFVKDALLNIRREDGSSLKKEKINAVLDIVAGDKFDFCISDTDLIDPDALVTISISDLRDPEDVRIIKINNIIIGSIWQVIEAKSLSQLRKAFSLDENVSIIVNNDSFRYQPEIKDDKAFIVGHFTVELSEEFPIELNYDLKPIKGGVAVNVNGNYKL
jgi:hypothetical protein